MTQFSMLLLHFAISTGFIDIQTLYSFDADVNDDSEFQWENCNMSEAHLLMKNLSLKPHPVVMTGTKFQVEINATISVSRLVCNKTALEMEMSLRLKRPGEDDLELCTIFSHDICYKKDICGELEKWIFNETKTDNDDLSNFGSTPSMILYNYTTPLLQSPPFLLKGKFVIQLTLKEEGYTLGCLQMKFCANKCTVP